MINHAYLKPKLCNFLSHQLEKVEVLTTMLKMLVEHFNTFLNPEKDRFGLCNYSVASIGPQKMHTIYSGLKTGSYLSKKHKNEGLYW